MSKAKIAINGFGRIGRAFFKLAITRPELEVIAINDLGNLESLAYLLKYDSAYGRYDKKVEIVNENGQQYLTVGDPTSPEASKDTFKKILFLNVKDATQLPWGQLGIDIVVESSGAFETYEKIAVHKQAGAKRVVLTAPAKDEDGPDAKTVLVGINEGDLKTCTLSSNGSCTTNSASPVMQILSDKLGIKKAFLNTIHAYTASQTLIDGPTKGHDLRQSRAAAVNIVPHSTGSAIAVARAVESLKGKFDGVAMRVPLITGSLSAITFVSERTTSVEEINQILTEASKEPRWQKVFKTTTEPLVSTDIIGDPVTAIADLSLTRVVDGDLCSVYSWYDNEFGYTNALVEHVLKVAEIM